MDSSPDLIERAQAGDEAAFRQLVDAHRHELHLHCYRMLGSFHDAEDALQETLIAAWRGLSSFEGRSSIRTWLYRVATSRCLNMLRSGRAGAREEGLMQPTELPQPTRLGEVLWIEPYPDALIDRVADPTPGPEAHYQTTEASLSRSSPRCSCCRPASGPSTFCAMCLASIRRKSRRCSRQPKNPSTA